MTYRIIGGETEMNNDKKLKKSFFENQSLKKRVKTLIAKSQKNDLIKSHVASFAETPVTQENHRGKISSYKALR